MQVQRQVMADGHKRSDKPVKPHGQPSPERDDQTSAVDDELVFSERTLPIEPFDGVNFAVYLVFLLMFCFVTIGRQGEAPFQLAKFARDQIGHDEFLQVSLARPAPLRPTLCLVAAMGRTAAAATMRIRCVFVAVLGPTAAAAVHTQIDNSVKYEEWLVRGPHHMDYPPTRWP